MRFAHAMLAMTQPRHERRTGGAHSATGRAIYTPAPPLPPLVSWGWTLIVALFGALLRIIRLGEPRAVVFDETYYVKDA